MPGVERKQQPERDGTRNRCASIGKIGFQKKNNQTTDRLKEPRFFAKRFHFAELQHDDVCRP